MVKIASVVPFPGINSNCIVSIFAVSLIIRSNARSITFIGCSSNFITLYDLGYIPLDLFSLWKLVAKYYSSSHQGTIKLHREVNHNTVQSSSAIYISNTIPVGPAALPFFIIYSFRNLIFSDQFIGSLYLFTGCGIVPYVLFIQQFLRVLSPYLFHLDIFYQHFSICIFNTSYSHYILPGFCYVLCNPVDILLSCCTLQLTNKLLLCFSLYKSNTSSCISPCLLILILITCCFGFMPYLIASFFSSTALHSTTMPWWSFCPPTYLFCGLLPYLFHCIPFTFYTVSFKYLIFALCYHATKLLSYTGISHLPYFQPWCAFSFSFLLHH